MKSADRRPSGPASIAIQQSLAGQFSIERELGRGGSGIVYLAREVRLDRAVAIKLLPPALAADPKAREHFLREARTAAKLAHPNIVPVYRADEVEGCVFFTMACVDGPTLGAQVRRSGALTPIEAVPIVRDVAWALAYAHARGVVHRDIKPDNILLDRATRRALVSDFGIAQVQNPHLGPPSNIVIGSAHFMSPEQAAGKSVDARSDIYSLGVLAWYALTGRYLFEGRPETVLTKHVTERPPSLLAVAPHVPLPLAQAVTSL